MTRTKLRPALTAAIALSLFVVTARAETYEIDPGHSSVTFTIRHLVSKVAGRFDDFEGTIQMDGANPSTSKVRAEIDTASINTGIENRDKHLKSGDFFDAEKNPKIVFESTSVTAKGTDKATLTGNLTLHGVTKPVTIEVTGLGTGPGMRGEVRAGFEGKTTINRKDFGIVWNRALDAGAVVLGDDVEIVLLVEAVRKDAAPAPAAAPAAAAPAPAPKAP